MFKNYLLILLLLLNGFSAKAQQPTKPNSSEIYESIKKLQFLGSVLYIAAHPDDENTKLISYFANEVKARTAYLSVTRGDGGQNLIGPELGELLGAIRTQELLEARRIDGGEQMFTRANDFGYSKHPDETLAIWNKDEVLGDMVWAIRNFRPDIIINRFDHRSPGSTHGHHTSSAILSLEAFDLANNRNAYPKQLEYTTVWQPKRTFFNTSWWFYGSQENFDQADKTNLLGIDTGVFFPSMGLSNPEVAALSRSSHKSQGFGSTGARGEQMEYLELIKGDMPKYTSNIFEGIDTSWNKVKGGKTIGNMLKDIQDNYDFRNPSSSIPKLLEAYHLMNALEDQHWKAIKIVDLKNVIAACAGLYMEAAAETNQSTANEDVKLKIEAINRSAIPMTLRSLSINTQNHNLNKPLTQNAGFTLNETLHIKADQQPTAPYWLMEKGSLGMYKVSDQRFIGQPETPNDINVTFNIEIGKTPITFTKTIIYKSNDPVKGEVYKPFEIIPEVSVKLSEPVIIFDNDQPKNVQAIVTAGKNQFSGVVTLGRPKGWSVYPEKQSVKIEHKGDSHTILFTVIPPKEAHEGLLSPVVKVGDKNYTKTLVEINYDHIPYQSILLPSESKVVRLDIKKRGDNIGYIQGAGDAIPESLRQIGYNVTILDPENISLDMLNRFDAIVMGIRAYNTIDALKFKQSLLFDYMARGGNLIVQYNTSRELLMDQISPYDLQLSRDRVSEENAEVHFLNPDHELMNYPNKITQNDFKGWIQERGLYFPDKWGSEFTPLFSMNDKGETPKEGSLLVAKFGKGHYIYTGLSFFRELPAGVPGAYRLFANMLSIGKNGTNAENTQND